MRKAFVYILSLLLLIALLGIALSTSSKLAFAKPDKLENWLAQSNIYAQLPARIVQNAPSTFNMTINGQNVSIPLEQSTLTQAAQIIFTPQLIQGDVSQFLNANYAWLEGESSLPDFRINLTTAQTGLGQNIASTLLAKLANLPTCSADQLKQMGASFNLTTAVCLPPGTNLSTVESRVTQEVADNINLPGKSSLLTANSLETGTSKPYYQTASWLPNVYRLSLNLPWLFSIVAILCGFGIIWFSPRKRRGVRRLAWLLGEAGIILILIRVAIYIVFERHHVSITPVADSKQLVTAFSTLLRLILTYMSTIDLRFGAAYLGIALVLLIALVTTRHKTPKQAGKDPLSQTEGTNQPVIPSTNIYKKPAQPRRPRLIQ